MHLALWPGSLERLDEAQPCYDGLLALSGRNTILALPQIYFQVHELHLPGRIGEAAPSLNAIRKSR